eukprot:660630-Alexandrium_andersonii.AAC.1
MSTNSGLEAPWLPPPGPSSAAWQAPPCRSIEWKDRRGPRLAPPKDIDPLELFLLPRLPQGSLPERRGCRAARQRRARARGVQADTNMAVDALNA